MCIKLKINLFIGWQIILADIDLSELLADLQSVICEVRLEKCPQAKIPNIRISGGLLREYVCSEKLCALSNSGS